MVSTIRPLYCRGCGVELDYELIDVAYDPQTGKATVQKERLFCQLDYSCDKLDVWTRGWFGWWWGGATW